MSSPNMSIQSNYFRLNLHMFDATEKWVCFFPIFCWLNLNVSLQNTVFLQVKPPISGRNKDMIWAVFQTPVGWWLIRGLYWPTSRFFFANPWAEDPDEPISIKRRLNGLLNTAHFGRWPHQLLVAAGWWRIGWSVFDCFVLGGSGTKLRPLAIEAARIQVFQILAKNKSERGCQVSQVKNWI